ncbi:MAG: hypothetical protein JRI34_13990, partial [Deltaproteobacteria bacterium]|nr:hypothetical protein [Deltaproteobacteria bacterium]
MNKVTIALLVFVLLSGVANAAIIDFDSYTNIQAIENDYNLDFSSLWDIKTDGRINQLGFFIDFADAAEYIGFNGIPVQMQSVYVLSSGGTISGLKDGTPVENTVLPINTPATVDLSGWGT